MIHIENLHLTLGSTPLLRGINLTLHPKERVGLVGKSGSGKTLLAKTLLKLLPPHAHLSGSLHFQGRDLLQASPKEMRQIRGKQIGMVLQDPLSSLNPTRTVGSQIAEILPSKSQVPALLSQVQLDPLLASSYPHELSGGQRQRVCIAIGIANHPQLLIADEPTSALDCTIQLHILKLLTSLDTGILLITHDLKIAHAFCDRIVVMREGKLCSS